MATGKRGIARALQKVLGQGGNVNADNPLEVRDAKVGSLISYEGVTTADGAGAGTSLEDSVLATKPDYNGNLVIITSGAYAGQGSDINGVTTGGTVTAHSAFDGQILRGTNFVIVALRLVPAEVAAIAAALGTHDTDIKALLATIAAYIDTKAMGRAQIAATTIDLNQAAGTYDLFTGTAQVVRLKSLNIKMPTGAAGGALTSISIQTDDATPGIIISAANGAVANLTSEADLGWTGTLYIAVGTKIQLTIAGGAHGGEYICDVIAEYRAVISGGYLA